MDCVLQLDGLCTENDKLKIPDDLASLSHKSEHSHYMCISFKCAGGGTRIAQCVLTDTGDLCEKFQSTQKVSNCTLDLPENDIDPTWWPTGIFITTSKNEDESSTPEESPTTTFKLTELISISARKEEETSISTEIFSTTSQNEDESTPNVSPTTTFKPTKFISTSSGKE
ncbi:unnamed protein product [Acanthoscelides obtectus]|uniref:Uncharacterized protein n=1 Tax=Acanthoscelides obtectus TaxID=200917 RepID=A0A9P0LZJ9_ACAOB|nr:unnamed protein product [Acanthoscelides obtectus]CAK1674229.1 hypothetical protein AOBTE_LOCUS29559 [Acanthoscelides obtectus]